MEPQDWDRQGGCPHSAAGQEQLTSKAELPLNIPSCGAIFILIEQAKELSHVTTQLHATLVSSNSSIDAQLSFVSEVVCTSRRLPISI